MNDLKLSCSCGAVKGKVNAVAIKAGNRIVCCCYDCQAFTESLDRDKGVLDDHGGTDIFQVFPSSVEITAGKDQIRCLRLSEKGTNRWYTDCCKTPVGNTLSAGVPFIGLISSFWLDKNHWNEMIGPPSATVQTKCARNLPEDAPEPVGFPLAVTANIVFKILSWKLMGKGSPHPFFHPDGTPIAEPINRESIL